MSNRNATYTTSKKITDALTNEMIEGMVKATVDKAYNRNLRVYQGVFVNRFNTFLIDGKFATGGELLKALAERPDTVTQELPCVFLTEEKGEDVARIVFQSEVDLDNDKLGEAMKKVLSQPPDITLAAMLAETKRRL